jgi:DNA-binding CsgD family transcriptional regulator
MADNGFTLAIISKQHERYLRMRCSGKTMAQIAQEERVSSSMVKGACQRAAVKLGLSTHSHDGTIARICYQIGRLDGAVAEREK